jgi:hypothetical protein
MAGVIEGGAEQYSIAEKLPDRHGDWGQPRHKCSFHDACPPGEVKESKYGL